MPGLVSGVWFYSFVPECSEQALWSVPSSPAKVIWNNNEVMVAYCGKASHVYTVCNRNHTLGAFIAPDVPAESHRVTRKPEPRLFGSFAAPQLREFHFSSTMNPICTCQAPFSVLSSVPSKWMMCSRFESLEPEMNNQASRVAVVNQIARQLIHSGHPSEKDIKAQQDKLNTRQVSTFISRIQNSRECCCFFLKHIGQTEGPYCTRTYVHIKLKQCDQIYTFSSVQCDSICFNEWHHHKAEI